jgi:hypothetical protein
MRTAYGGLPANQLKRDALALARHRDGTGTDGIARGPDGTGSEEQSIAATVPSVRAALGAA